MNLNSAELKAPGAEKAVIVQAYTGGKRSPHTVMNEPKVV